MLISWLRYKYEAIVCEYYAILPERFAIIT